MISLADVYHVVAATVPLYFSMILAYVSVKCCKLFTPEQCDGINKFVAEFSIPLLSFQIISSINPYKMTLKLILADFLQKLLSLLALAALAKLSSRGRMDWIITGLSLSTLPNTSILGIPLLTAMCGVKAMKLLSQIVGLQNIIWYNLLLFMFELNAAKATSAAPHSETTEEAEAVTRRNVKTMRILLTVGRKLMANPNFHASWLGLIWACIHFRWGVNLPDIVDKSIMILATGGRGMAMFSLASSQNEIRSIYGIANQYHSMWHQNGSCGYGNEVHCRACSDGSVFLGLRGTAFKVAVVQAALPQGILPIVFAKKYNVHPDILSAGVILGMLIALPISLAYYCLLAL